jgi:CheY-like chemotaxis protein
MGGQGQSAVPPPEETAEVMETKACSMAKVEDGGKKTVLLHELPNHLADAPWNVTHPAGDSDHVGNAEVASQREQHPQVTATATVEEPASEANMPGSWAEPTPSSSAPGSVVEAGVWKPEPEAGDLGPESSLGWRERPGRQVLVIDDDATMRMLLKMGLGRRGYDCLTAENGKVAQAVLERSKPDLILVDLMMPVMDGLTFIHWLRQIARDSTPVLVFTNVDTPQITQEALASGANAFACKPLHLRELMELMNQLVPC